MQSQADEDTLTNKFCRDPVAFAKETSLDVMSNYATSFKQKGNNQLQIGALDRIAWFRLETQSTPNVYSVRIMREPDSPECIPAYYLPYKNDNISRITLRTSKKANDYGKSWKYALGEAYDKFSIRSPLAGPYGGYAEACKDLERVAGLDPDFFFTDNLSGCSVYAEGPVEAPTIYHANAMSQGDYAADQNMQEVFSLRDRKIKFMRKEYISYSKAHPKTSRPNETSGGGANKRSVDYGDYGRFFPVGFGGPKIFEDFRPSANNLLKKLNYKNDSKSVDLQSVGCVFGYRKDGEWHLCFQKQICTTEHFADGPSLFRFHVLQFSEFWPKGGKRVAF